jgi:hypothetical protein
MQLKVYGEFVAVRLHGAFLQIRATDESSDSKAPVVVIGNGGDAAKVVGLWPQIALMPTPAPVGPPDP